MEYPRAIQIFLVVIALFVCAAAFAQESQRVTPVVKVIKEWGPSVVNISTERVIVLRTHPYWSQFNGAIADQDNPHTMNAGTMSLKSIGSGVVVSKDGLVLTNAHVVNKASKIYVVTSDGKRAEAKVEVISQDDDLALIKIDPPESLRPVKIANDAIIGETVVAIGNPLGLENSVSSGIIGGIGRNILINKRKIPALSGLIQTDAAINQGSSGGAILNMDGELVGVSLAVLQNANSISFAIPYNKIKSLMAKYKNGGILPVLYKAPDDSEDKVKIKVE